MPTFYIDLDRTAFRTEQVAMIYRALAQLYPDNQLIASGYDARDAYYVLSDNHDGDGDRLYHHDLGAQLRDAGIEPTEAFAKLIQVVGDGRFEYPGLAQLVAAARARGEVKVLTYGTDDYQRFKAALCPHLAGVEVLTVLTPKSDYLNSYTGPDDWVIDDKLLVGVTSGARIVRVGHGERATADTLTLEQVTQLIEREVPSDS